MRKSRFSEGQIISILKESEGGVETGELCRRHGIAKACSCSRSLLKRIGKARNPFHGNEKDRWTPSVGVFDTCRPRPSVGF